MSTRTPGLDLYLVTDTRLCGGPEGVVTTVKAAIRGGVTMVQVRDPLATDADFLALARRVVAVGRAAGVPVVLNDRVHLVNAAEADGAHIGQNDMQPLLARAALGPDALLGLSCSTEDEVRAANALPVGVIDHLGLGPVYEQSTKPDAGPPLGATGLARLVSLSDLPAVAIGGVNAERLPELRATGVDGPCVVSAICASPSPQAAARALVTCWKDLA